MCQAVAGVRGRPDLGEGGHGTEVQPWLSMCRRRGRDLLVLSMGPRSPAPGEAWGSLIRGPQYLYSIFKKCTLQYDFGDIPPKRPLYSMYFVEWQIYAKAVI